VAAFNIVATLVMIVKEKQTDIAILRTHGRRSTQCAADVRGAGRADRTRRHPARSGASARLLADNLQSLVGALEHLLGTQFLDARVYYMSDLPAYVEGIDVLRVCGVAFVLCALATVYPAWRAARTAPAQLCAMSDNVLEARGVHKSFRQGPVLLPVLQGVALRGVAPVTPTLVAPRTVKTTSSAACVVSTGSAGECCDRRDTARPPPCSTAAATGP